MFAKREEDLCKVLVDGTEQRTSATWICTATKQSTTVKMKSRKIRLIAFERIDRWHIGVNDLGDYDVISLPRECVVEVIICGVPPISYQAIHVGDIV